MFGLNPLAQATRGFQQTQSQLSPLNLQQGGLCPSYVFKTREVSIFPSGKATMPEGFLRPWGLLTALNFDETPERSNQSLKCVKNMLPFPQEEFIGSFGGVKSPSKP
eukprot:TRINITY_DN2222_c0_g1_i4.p3 TRINITY_DN2222_c0_g1~~TRINITY_DN2222_c0_g1_i4.p3  ORF type:complete len:107 (-),score=18.07 TRINITY_DN2222_c0_g1_i4:157-477(-)